MLRLAATHAKALKESEGQTSRLHFMSRISGTIIFCLLKKSKDLLLIFRFFIKGSFVHIINKVFSTK